MLDNKDNYRIISLLKQFGCKQREAEIYIQSLMMGPSSVQEIARKLKFNRVTAHSAIQQLIEKGFLYESRKGKKRLVVAEDPSFMNKLLQKNENEITLMKSNLEYITGVLDSMQARDRSVPSVKLYEDVEGFKKMLEESLDAKSEILVFTYVDLFSKLLDPDYLEDYFDRRAKKGIHTRLIFPPCDFATRVNKKAKEYKIQVRLMPAEFKWKAGFFSWNNKISIKSFTEGKLTCTIIENEDITYFYKKIIFEVCWKVAAPMID
jgi:HTH-type transcriptional regulator, sugar sensing transcriptional regulator